MNIHFARVDLAKIKARLSAHLLTLASPVDSFLEDHILQSHHYHILLDGEMADRFQWLLPAAAQVPTTDANTTPSDSPIDRCLGTQV